MKRALLNVVAAAALAGAGWSIGRAQPSAPDFEIVVDAPAGATTIRCVRGCSLKWIQRGNNPNARQAPAFEFECSAGTGDGRRCGSGRVGGWIAP